MTATTIGPYRIEKKIGSGGMGAVYKAWDSRLERWVAIKTILPDREISEDRLERFRREARSNARINHPAIAQVHDIISEDGRDHIVMELVEGETINHQLQQGPLTPERAVFLATQIVDGLAAAHALGLIHRDLKASNIMVTEDDRVKILDFGLAKIVEPEAGTRELTQEGMVIGTCRAMSPEQAEGQKLDHRSDLFSLGTLLYRMVTGTHPFAAASAVATMRRIVYDDPPPPSNLVSSLPPELSDLIMRLLAKEPESRPNSATNVGDELISISTMWSGPTMVRAVAAHTTAAVSAVRRRNRILSIVISALVLIIGGLVAWHWWSQQPRALTTVAVLEPEIDGEADGIDLARRTVRSALLNGIASLRGLSVIDTGEIDGIEGSATDIAQATSANEILVSRIEGCDPQCSIQIRRLDAEGRLIPGTVKDFQVLADDLFLIDEATTANLRGIFQHRRVREGFKSTVADPSDFAAFVEIQHQWSSPPKGVTKEQLLDRIVQIRRTSPKFLAAHIAEANGARFLFESTSEPAYLDQAQSAVERAVHLAPEDPRALGVAIDVNRAAGDYAEAQRILDKLAAISPSDLEVLFNRAFLAQSLGDQDTAIEAFEKAFEIRPSWKTLEDLAVAEMFNGQMESAEKHVRQGLEMAPGSPGLLSTLGQIQLIEGRFDGAIVTYRSLAESNPSPIYSSNLGLAQMMQGHFQESAEAFLEALNSGDGHPTTLLNLGDSYTLAGEIELGITYYEEALERIESLPEADARDVIGAQAQCLAHLGRDTEAVRVAQKGLRLGPDDPQTHYDAAIVYAVTGDRNAALVHKERAIELGMDPVWLNLPWFDWLASDEDDPSIQS